ncbi:GPDA-like protein [Mya arenaria]|uniref:Glycerol-3-phosphate dehydrogenase [NAD(+)] n=1 Tax=Mya arenaria TaxID=6604 RepID=A0ABY7EBP2_MYAAR|nr:GPDA-like protein [Mya arenaria]
MFESRVNMYMYEETFEGQKLTEVVNREHENVKYLPGIKLPENVVAIPDLVEASKNADLLIFVMPHQFVRGTCKTMQEHIKDSALAVSLIKGFDTAADGSFLMISKMIEDILSIDCCVLMGANLAPEVAEEQFCETTIGCKTEEQGELLKSLFEKPYFRCSVNVVAIGAGIVDGCKEETFFESCGVADLVATCHGGRNRLLGETVVKSDKTIRQLEKEILRGQSFQGPLVAKDIFKVLSQKNMLERFFGKYMLL